MAAEAFAHLSGWRDYIASRPQFTKSLAKRPTSSPFVLLDDARQGRGGLLLSTPIQVIAAWHHDEVAGAIQEALSLIASGVWVAGFLAYEAGLALEPRLKSLASHRGQTPLVWFAAFSQCEEIGDVGRWLPPARPLGPVELDWTFERYEAACRRAIGYIESGDIYQVNLTMPGKVKLADHPLAQYAWLRSRQASGWGGVIFDGADWLLSCTPEEFFSLYEGQIRCRPMKGTAPRGEYPAQDLANAEWLASSSKDRAENLMIVDLMRNDLARVCVPGTVKVPHLWTVERYPTLFQMTSTVEGCLLPRLDLADVLRALFPCGSITGAPKLRAIEIISELEARIRGPYAGTMGVIAPDGSASFNILIRTLRVPRGAAFGLTDVGSGIVSDSTPEGEWRECHTKLAYLAGQYRQAGVHS